jgi:hypothetical protein
MRYLGVPATVNPAPPVLVARHDESAGAYSATSAADLPLVDFVTDGGPGTVPDVRGMSAREAMRKLVKAGLSTKLVGDGFVVAQDPQPGSAIEDGAVCRLTLARAAMRAATTGAPQ